ncbi:MAG: hypothetical protein KGL48_07575 [Sphingomonadales bacterium]|nr:hypothetical protein [Sphingomonadales bacterium]MDE2568782.1 hypothetical protein [Sphingomonadales bacterium]
MAASSSGASRPRAASSRRRPAEPRWTKPFLAALAETSNVTAAARKAKVDTSTAYSRRRDDADFNRRWQVALCEGYDNLEMELLHRLRSGELKPVTGARRAARSFDNATAFRLLAAHRESATRERAMREHTSTEEIRAQIEAKVADLRERARRNAETLGAEVRDDG